MAQKTTGHYQVKIISHTPVKSIRGLSVVTDQVLWASGTGGQVGRSTDGGVHWQWHQIAGCDSCDWRSLYAFNADKAVVLNAGSPAQIFLTTDGGASWRSVFSDLRPGIFFDALQFFDDKEGIAIGDPLQQRFPIIRTYDGGLTWQEDPITSQPAAQPGEALFAASNSSLVTLPGKKVYFATGGKVARLFMSISNWQSYTIPVVQGYPSVGVFSIAFRNEQQGIAVGGDYKNDTARQGNCVLTDNGGQTWYAPVIPPYGYRSGVTWLSSSSLVATGTTGTDVSTDGGKTWSNIGPGFNVTVKARKGTKVYLAGSDIGIVETNSH
ncbi:oxidoreductase [Chitinophaga sp. 30R24]|uniref:oxidoreductase n=1 Tax=Chitinophaga sp. 30R24 TaxID=3248838 RepID=UPI003B90F7DB